MERKKFCEVKTIIGIGCVETKGNERAMGQRKYHRLG